MSLACSGQLVVPTLLGKPRQQGNTVSVSRCSAVCPQKLALRITAAFGRRQCSWRLQRNSSCCVANATAETHQNDESPRSTIQQQRVIFRTTHQVNYGEVIKVIGQGPQLGKWEVSTAPAMEWSEGDNWYLEVDLFPGVTDFKCAVVRQDGSVASWEPGANRTVEVPHESVSSAIRVNCTWSNTGNTIQALSMDEDDQADFTFDSMDDEDEHEATFRLHSGAEASSSSTLKSDAESHVQSPGSAEQQMDSADWHSEYGDVGDNHMGRTSTGGGGASTTLQGNSNSASAKGQAGFLKDSKSQKGLAPGPGAHLGEGNGSSALTLSGVPTPPNPQPPGNPQAFHDQQQMAPSTTGSTGQLAAGLAGLLAVPVVAWSEYTLKTTGCGLPPGPGGVLGAAEGVAYLAVAALAVWSVASKLFSGHGLPNGLGGVLAGAEKLALTTTLAGFAVLGSQVRDYGYVPAALPDSNCFGPTSSSAPASFVASTPAASATQPFAAMSGSRITELSRSLLSVGTAPSPASSTALVAVIPSPSTSLQGSKSPHPDPSGRPELEAPTFIASAAQSTEAAKKSAGDLWTSLRATYNSVAETISELDFRPLGKQATFVKDTLGAGFAGLGKSAAVVSQQLAQDVNRTTQGTTSELQNRSEEVYAGAVDGLSSSDINAVVEELENGVNSVVQGVEHEAEVLKKAFQEALHRAMGSVALLGTSSLQDSFHHNALVSDASVVRHASITSAQPVRYKRVLQPLLGGVSVHSPAQQQPYYALQQPSMTMVSGASEELHHGASLSLLLPVVSHGQAQAPSRQLQPLWDQQEVALRVLELSLRSVSVPLAQVSLDVRGMLVEANMMMMGAAATNAVSAANNVNATLGNAIQQLRVTVDTLKQTVNDVCAIAHRDRIDLNSLYKAVANLDDLLGGAKMTASSVELAPLAHQLDDAAASIRANESGVEADQLAGRLVKAATCLRDTSSSISVTATLENAQRIVSKIPATAANEEDIAPLLQEFEELTAQLQAELDKLSAVTNNISPSSL